MAFLQAHSPLLGSFISKTELNPGSKICCLKNKILFRFGTANQISINLRDTISPQHHTISFNLIYIYEVIQPIKSDSRIYIFLCLEKHGKSLKS